MKIFYFLLAVLPTLCLAEISVNIVASYKDEHNSVEYFGSNIDVISDEERNTFKLSDNQLKEAVRTYFGARPDDAYLRSPTPWGDLYKTYGWSQVYRTLSPQRAKILRKSSEPVIVLTQDFVNNSTKEATFNAAIKQEVSNTVTSTWQTGGSISVGQEIKFGIDLEVFEASTTISMDFTSNWGQSTSKSKTVTVGSSSGVEITLKPGQKVTAELQATRGAMEVQVDYEASLSGSTAINYSSTYKGHHFWALGISSVMSSSGISNSVKSSQVLKIGFYSEAHVVIRDKTYNQHLYTFPVLISRHISF